MPGHATSCWIHSPHTDPGVKVGNMAKKPTPGPRTIGNECTCSRPGRRDGDAGPSGNNGQDDDGDDDGNQKKPRPLASMINGSGFYKPKPGKPKKPKNVVVAGMLMYTPMRAPPPPPSCGSVEDGSSEGQRDTKSMSTFQRMLTPPVSDTGLPSKKLPYEDF